MLAGEPGPVRDAVLLNAGIALALTELDEAPGRFGPESDLDALVRRGIERARAAIDEGAAAAALERWVTATARWQQPTR